MGLQDQQKSHVFVIKVGLGTDVIFQNARRVVQPRMAIAPSQRNVCASLAGLVMIVLTVCHTQGVTLNMVAVRSLGSASVEKDGLEHFAMKPFLTYKQINRTTYQFLGKFIFNSEETIGY